MEKLAIHCRLVDYPIRIVAYYDTDLFINSFDLSCLYVVELCTFYMLF